MHHNLTILLIACVLEAIFSYPRFIYNTIKHPVIWMGAVISCLEQNFNYPINPLSLWERVRVRAFGIITMLLLLLITISISLIIQYIGNIYIEIICIASLLAFRSLYTHVNAIYQPLSQQNLQDARNELAKIVGRDVEELNESEICRASIESLAESFSDGVVAPIFWAALFGLPGIACYKAINTADSMIGHKTKQYKYFGWAAARLDDAANYIPARLSAVLIIICNPTKSAAHTIWHDARKHASPNSGYPESAMAGILSIRLGGKRSYDGEKYNAPLIGEGLRENITIIELKKSLLIYVKTCILLTIILLIQAIYLILAIYT